MENKFKPGDKIVVKSNNKHGTVKYIDFEGNHCIVYPDGSEDFYYEDELEPDTDTDTPRLHTKEDMWEAWWNSATIRDDTVTSNERAYFDQWYNKKYLDGKDN